MCIKRWISDPNRIQNKLACVNKSQKFFLDQNEKKKCIQLHKYSCVAQTIASTFYNGIL